MSVMNSVARGGQAVLVGLGSLLASELALAHGAMLEDGLSARAAAAISWRSVNQQSADAIANQEVWQIPGVLMGGHTSTYESGTSLDELSLILGYRRADATDLLIKAGSHGGTDLALENVMVGKDLFWQEQPLRLEAGLMTAFFSPNNHYHPSEGNISLTPLGFAALLGSHVQDTGVRMALGDSHDGISAGLESYKGSAYPASGNQGLHAGFVGWSWNADDLQLRLQGWYLTASASNRLDDRSASSSHSHSSTSSTAFTGTFDGDTHGRGIYWDLDWGRAGAWGWGLGGEYMQVDVDGTVSNSTLTQQIGLDGEYRSLLLEPRLQWQLHIWALRYERLSLSNDLTGTAVDSLGDEAGLINQGHNPTRLALVWGWRYSPALKLRLEWLQDQSLPERQPSVIGFGLVWRNSLL